MIPTIRTLSFLGVIATVIWLFNKPGYAALLACILTFSVFLSSFLPLRRYAANSGKNTPSQREPQA